MKEESLTDASLRQFLLGNVDDEERQRIEMLFITDSLARERILAAEEELLEDYLEDFLPPADREKFVARYGNSRAQQRHLRIVETIRDWAISEGNRITSESQSSSLKALFARFRLKPMFVMPIAAIALIAVVVVGFWLTRKIELKNRKSALEQEIGQLNAPSNTSSSSYSLTLRPLVLRSTETPPMLEVGPTLQIIELRLVLNQNESYQNYEGVLRQVGAPQSLSIRNLRPEKDGRIILLKLPAHRLEPGLYQLQLSGVASDGSVSPSEEYQFEISG